MREGARRRGPDDPRKAMARYLADVMRDGTCPSDRAFDRLMPDALRLVAPEYWTPLAVVRRAAAWMEAHGIRRVADIGSGAGKFCVAGALFGTCRFVGFEQYDSLVSAARELADLFDLGGRVRFVTGTLGVTPAPAADAYYFFNPFGEYRLGPDYPTEPDSPCSEARYADHIAAAEDLLRHVRPGTWVLTYNGFGGRMPAGFRVMHVDSSVRGELRLWRKEPPAPKRRRTASARG